MTTKRFVTCPFCGARVCGTHVGCAPIYSAVMGHFESEHSLSGAAAAQVAHVVAGHAIGVASDGELNMLLEALVPG